MSTTEQSTDAPDTPASGQGSEVTRYTSYTVFRRLAGLADEGDLTAAQIEQSLAETVTLIEAAGAELLGFYDMTGFRAEDDLMLWLAADDPAALQAALRELESSLAGTWLHREWASVGVHRQAESPAPTCPPS